MPIAWYCHNHVNLFTNRLSSGTLIYTVILNGMPPRREGDSFSQQVETGRRPQARKKQQTHNHNGTQTNRFIPDRVTMVTDRFRYIHPKMHFRSAKSSSIRCWLRATQKRNTKRELSACGWAAWCPWIMEAHVRDPKRLHSPACASAGPRSFPYSILLLFPFFSRVISATVLYWPFVPHSSPRSFSIMWWLTMYEINANFVRNSTFCAHKPRVGSMSCPPVGQGVDTA